MLLVCFHVTFREPSAADAVAASAVVFIAAVVVCFLLVTLGFRNTLSEVDYKKGSRSIMLYEGFETLREKKKYIIYAWHKITCISRCSACIIVHL